MTVDRPLTYDEAEAAGLLDQIGTPLAEAIRDASPPRELVSPRRVEPSDHEANEVTTGAVVTTVADVDCEAVRWLWPARLPLGKVVVLDGDPGLGKSTLMLDIAARVSTGSPMPDGVSGELYRQPAGVVLLSAEDGIADTIRPRLEAAGADLERVHSFDAITELVEGEPVTRPPTIPGDTRDLMGVVRDTAAALVVVDPVMAFLGARLDAHKDTDVRRALHALSTMAERTGAVVVIVRHLNKAGGGHPLYRGGGSIGIIGAARAGLLVAPDPEDEGRRILAVTKSNLAPVPSALAYRLVTDERLDVARVAWEGATGHSAADLLSTDTEEERGAQREAVDILRHILEGGPMAANGVKRQAKEAGVAERTLERAKKKLNVQSERKGFGADGVWTWRLPGHSPPLDAYTANGDSRLPMADR